MSSNPRVSFPFALEAHAKLKEHPYALFEWFAVVVAGPEGYPLYSDKLLFLIQEGFYTEEEALRWEEDRKKDGKAISLLLLPARRLLVFPQDGRNWANVEYQKEKLDSFHKDREKKLIVDMERRKLCMDSTSLLPLDPLKLGTEKKVERKEFSKCEGKTQEITEQMHVVPESCKYSGANCCLVQIMTGPQGEALLMLVAGSDAENVTALGDLLTKNPHYYTGLRLSDLVTIRFNVWKAPEYSLASTGEKRWTLRDYVDEPRLQELICH